MKRSLLLAFAFALMAGLAPAEEAIFGDTGLLLLKTDPQDCDIMINGVSVGRTPRLITDLDCKGNYKVKFRKEGYLDQTISVSFDGRKPVVREEKMLLASGTIDAMSDPAGAEVTVNGIARGKTPIKLTGIPKGLASIEFSMPGFITERREIKIAPSDEQTLSISLKSLPGTLHLSSIPEGARFYVNGEPKGKGPLALAGLQPGEYEVRVELDGYAALSRKVVLGNGESANEEFKLSSMMGGLDIRTSPAGAQIELDGVVIGTTKEISEDSEFSAVFPVTNLLEGEHRLVVRKDGYAEAVRRPNIKNSKISRHNIRMKRVFIPDVEVTTSHGTYRGILKANTSTAVIIEVKLGIEQSFPRSEIRKINFLNAAP